MTSTEMDGSSVDITLDLLRRYDRPGPRYTSYPTAVEFKTSCGEPVYRERLIAADAAADETLSLYLHIPFCERRCHYCGCNVVITRRREIAARYLDYLHREIDMLAARLPHRRRVAQCHWGGGTPTYLDEEQIRALWAKITEHFTLEPDAEIAVEVDPRVTTRRHVELFRELGFNRISMGVQDFTAEVQQAIHRGQTAAETRALYVVCRELGFASINFDLIYGLPEQTPESFAHSMRTVLELRPDRVALYSFAYVPWMRPHQKYLRVESLPTPEVKLRLFSIARSMMLDAGYVAIGMDHFALPGDEMVEAMCRGRLGRNFMGYTVKLGGDTIGLGVSAIGDVQGCMPQNVKKLSEYYAALDAGRLPVEKGCVLDRDDEIRRALIMQLMCNFTLDVGELERRFDIDFATYFGRELDELRTGPVRHGFVEIDAGRIAVVGQGRLFVRNVCMIFDRYLREKTQGAPAFSQTV